MGSNVPPNKAIFFSIKTIPHPKPSTLTEEGGGEGCCSESFSNLPCTTNHVFRRGQLARAHRPAGVQLARRNADFRPEPENAAIMQPGRSVMKHGRRIHRF